MKTFPNRYCSGRGDSHASSESTCQSYLTSRAELWTQSQPLSDHWSRQQADDDPGRALRKKIWVQVQTHSKSCQTLAEPVCQYLARWFRHGQTTAFKRKLACDPHGVCCSAEHRLQDTELCCKSWNWQPNFFIANFGGFNKETWRIGGQISEPDQAWSNLSDSDLYKSVGQVIPKGSFPVVPSWKQFDVCRFPLPPQTWPWTAPSKHRSCQKRSRVRCHSLPDFVMSQALEHSVNTVNCPTQNGLRRLWDGSSILRHKKCKRSRLACRTSRTMDNATENATEPS